MTNNSKLYSLSFKHLQATTINTENFMESDTFSFLLSLFRFFIQ